MISIVPGPGRLVVSVLCSGTGTIAWTRSNIPSSPHSPLSLPTPPPDAGQWSLRETGEAVKGKIRLLLYSVLFVSQSLSPLLTGLSCFLFVFLKNAHVLVFVIQPITLLDQVVLFYTVDNIGLHVVCQYSCYHCKRQKCP